MRKIVFIIILSVFINEMSAQTTSFEVGLRLGFVIGIDAAFPVNSNRIHSNAGWGIDYFMFDNYYDFQIPVIQEKLFIYAGPGLGIRYWDKSRSEHEGIGIAVLGEAGIEYRFINPVSIGLDWTPFYDFIKSEFNNYGTLCLRYRF